MPLLKKITRKNLDTFLSCYATDKKVLDIGAGGSGYHKFFPNRLSMDIDPTRKPDVVADAHKLPFMDGEFEFILCTEVLEHVKNPQQVIDEILRVLAPGGTIVLTTRFVYPIHDAPNDFWRYTKFALIHLFRNFELLEIVPEAKSFTALAILFQRIAFQSRLRANKLTKAVLFLCAYVLEHLDWLIVEEYSDIKKSAREHDIMTTGYYVAARKPL